MGRRKLDESRKKKMLSTSVNTELIGLYEDYLIENEINHKSKLIEQELKEIIKDGDRIRYLIEEDILPENNNLIK